MMVYHARYRFRVIIISNCISRTKPLYVRFVIIKLVVKPGNKNHFHSTYLTPYFNTWGATEPLFALGLTEDPNSLIKLWRNL